jgi:hypothetical protein
MKTFSLTETSLIAAGAAVVTGTATYFIARPSASESNAIKAITEFAIKNNLKNDKGQPDIVKATEEIRKANGLIEDKKPEEKKPEEKKAAKA